MDDDSNLPPRPIDLDAAEAYLQAARERVDHPRRLGPDYLRRGPVLFDPGQWARREIPFH